MTMDKKYALIPNGRTIFYTMIGTPIVQVKSPSLYNRYFSENRIDAVMIAMDIPVDQLSDHFRHMRTISNFGGCIVTIPHKQAAADCMDELSQRARDLGAVNVVRIENGRLVGDMVDGLGFVKAVNLHGLNLRGKKVAVIGGGGAGAAIAHAIAGAGANEIIIKEIQAKRHGFLKRLLKNVNPELKLSFELARLDDLDLVVNATPVGMNNDLDLPFSTDTLQPSTLVADVVTKPKVTPWLAAALKKGCNVQYGVEMAYGQFGLMGRHMGLEVSDPENLERVQQDADAG